jgi:integrase
MPVTRNPRAGIDDRWHKKVKGPDGGIRKERSAVYKKVARWRVRWVDETGEEHSKVFQLKDAAQAHLDRVTADVVKGEYVSPRKAAVTFGAMATEWLAGKELDGKGGRAPKTVAGYRSLLDKLILPRWEDTKLKDITHADVQRWVSGLSVNGSVRTEGNGLSASRVIQAHQCMSAVLKYAIRTERLSKNAATGVELPRKMAAEHRYLTHAQLLRLADVLTDAPGNLGTLTLVLGYCGLRTGEARALRARDVKDHTITVRASVSKVDGKGYVKGDTKNHRTRWVPVPEFLWESVEACAGSPDTLVFPGRDGYLTDFEYRRWFNPAAEKIGVPGLTPHELRHTCASLAISAGANVKAVQRLLGHETAAMTLDEYGHLFSDDLTKVAKSLNRAARTAARK